MSLNRVRRIPETMQFELFPEEKIFFTSLDSSTQLEYDNSGGYPGAGEQLLCLKGTIFLTDIRCVYLAASPSIAFQSLSIPLQNLEDAKLSEGWMGGSTYTAAMRSIQGEGFSKEWGQIKFTFKQKGADFKNLAEHLRSRMGMIPAQYVEALPSYQGGGGGGPSNSPHYNNAGPSSSSNYGAGPTDLPSYSMTPPPPPTFTSDNTYLPPPPPINYVPEASIRTSSLQQQQPPPPRQPPY